MRRSVFDTAIVYLEPGRYIYACFVDVGTTSAGDQGAKEHGGGHGGEDQDAAAKPHWKQGMRGELEVLGGA